MNKQPKTLPATQPVLLIDSREQRPLSFTGPTQRVTLATGDYSVLGLEDRVAIERKSLDDLIRCLSTDRERFERELARARGYNYFAVVVEGRWSDVLDGQYRSAMQPNAVFESISALSVRYGVPFLFAESRSIAARMVESLLLKYTRECVLTAERINKPARPNTEVEMMPMDGFAVSGSCVN